MKFGTVYFNFAFLTLILSCALNVILVRIVYKRRERIGFYRVFTYSFAIVDILYSLSYTAAQPFWYAGPGVMAFFSIAPWNDNYRVTCHVWFALFIFIALCSTCSFLYRYGLLCSSFIVSMFVRPERFMFTALALLAIYALSLYSSYVVYTESEDIRSTVQRLFGEEFSSDFMHSYMVMIDMNNVETRSKNTAASVALFVLTDAQPMIMIFCGFQINKTVKTRAMSDKLKKIHSRALKMLIAQTINPMILFFFPTTVNIIEMLTGADFGAVPKPLALMYGLFPIFNPILVIYYTDDYKRYLLGQSTSGSMPTQAALSSQNASLAHRRKMFTSRTVFVI